MEAIKLLFFCLQASLIYGLPTAREGSAFSKIQSGETSHSENMLDQGNDPYLIGPALFCGRPVIYTLGLDGKFVRYPPAKEISNSDSIIFYSVHPDGVLTRTDDTYRQSSPTDPIVEFKSTKQGDLVPCCKKNSFMLTEHPAIGVYMEGLNNTLIPIRIFYSEGHLSFVFRHHLLHMAKVKNLTEAENMVGRVATSTIHIIRKENVAEGILPDTACNGDIILFLLKNNGTLKRMPPDEFIPKGMRIKYGLTEDFALTPLLHRHPDQIDMTYVTTDNGDLTPCSTNTYILRADGNENSTMCFMLVRGGAIAPVTEILDQNKTVSYYFNGQLIHSTDQFKQIFSNTSSVVIHQKYLDTIPKEEGNNRSKRAALSTFSADTRNHIVPATCCYTCNGYGRRIPLTPLLRVDGNVALFKLTCKGYLQRLDMCKEPEFGYQLKFQLLPNFILTPVSSNKIRDQLTFTYTLTVNGSLIPEKSNSNSLKKAPASVMYFLLGSNKQLIPVRVKILPTNDIELFYQDCLIHTIPAELGSCLPLFTTFYSPLYAYLNRRIVVAYTDTSMTRCKTYYNGSSIWENPGKMTNDQGNDCRPMKDLYLVCPNSTRIKIELDFEEDADNGVPIIYELDCNGVLHRSPKDQNKNILLKSYRLACKGVLVPYNGKNGYIYLVDKLGNMMPYYYPESRIRAPFGLTVKYVQCRQGILLPVFVEIDCNDCVCYSFEGLIMYKKKTWSFDQILELKENDEDNEWNELEAKELSTMTLFRDGQGNIAYYFNDKDKKILRRVPQQKIDAYLVGTTGSFQLVPTGSLLQAPPQEPHDDTKVINMSIEDNGDLRVDSDNRLHPPAKYYLLCNNGDLMAVHARRRNGHLRFYKNGVRVGKSYVVERYHPTINNHSSTDNCSTSTGEMSLSPSRNSSSDEPYYISIPIKGASVAAKRHSCVDKKKCEEIRKTLEQIISKEPSMMHIELEMTEPILREICDLAERCSKYNHRKDLTGKIHRNLQDLKVESESSNPTNSSTPSTEMS